MIKRVKGNILEAKTEALVNTVNTVGVMGRGIALQFKQAFPENYKAYRKACERGEVQIGKMFIFDLGQLFKPRYIINFPTKKHWRQKSKMEYIEKGLKALVEEIKKLGIRSIAIPPLGCGLGGLNWREVYKRIESACGEIPNVEVIIYEPQDISMIKNTKVNTLPPRMTFGRAALLCLMNHYLEAKLEFTITLLEIHKLMYFLQEAGEPLKLKYVKGPYGPYAENLRHVLKRIEGHFITGFGDGAEDPYKEIKYKQKALEKAEFFLKQKPDTLYGVKRVKEMIEGFETPYGLELLSSVHWLASHEKNATSVKEIIRGIANWNERKQKLFRPEHIEVAWNRLYKKGWIRL
jgi:O-acetyl-ADP-ribose deacetylase (regulator of RNase III)